MESLSKSRRACKMSLGKARERRNEVRGIIAFACIRPLVLDANYCISKGTHFVQATLTRAEGDSRNTRALKPVTRTDNNRHSPK